MVLQIDKRKNRVVLSLGGNIGEVQKVFENARGHLQKKIGGLVLSSSLYSTKAWGVEDQPDFLNQVVVLETKLSPLEVLRCCLSIEEELGRIRKEKWHERIIDIDVLFYNDEIIDMEELVLPHPFIQDRNFILYPLVEIIPDFIHPRLEKTIIDLKNSCKDQLTVKKNK
jgi:2-amino-4-hydroxy-6-hydroxymethyldihydropteridine diphosphokinase